MVDVLLCSGRFHLQQKEYASALCILDIPASPIADFPTHYGLKKRKPYNSYVLMLLEILKIHMDKRKIKIFFVPQLREPMLMSGV